MTGLYYNPICVWIITSECSYLKLCVLIESVIKVIRYLLEKRNNQLQTPATILLASSSLDTVEPFGR
jgi:hypothetical protein